MLITLVETVVSIFGSYELSVIVMIVKVGDSWFQYDVQWVRTLLMLLELLKLKTVRLE